LSQEKAVTALLNRRSEEGKTMEVEITKQDLLQITEEIRSKFSRVADSPEGQFKYLLDNGVVFPDN
jgi:hypothetical protein